MRIFGDISGQVHRPWVERKFALRHRRKRGKRRKNWRESNKGDASGSGGVATGRRREDH
jgi:hypothetical protein